VITMPARHSPDRATWTDAIEIADAIEKLAAEGPSRLVAARLESEHCAGHRSDGSSCPVARWVRHITGHRVEVYATTWHSGPSGWIDLPSVVRDFVADFDAGCYPALIDDGKRSPC
jgi:hypothetical protein